MNENLRLMHWRTTLALVLPLITASSLTAQPNTWSQKAAFGGSQRYGAVAFSIGNKGYVGTGYNPPFTYTKDFWEYDPVLDAWTQKADFGGTARVGAAGFSIDTLGYIGTGQDDNGLRTDFWMYDPSSNTWTPRAVFAGVARKYATGFSIGNKGYIGIGSVISSLGDFWEYDPALDSWTQKTSFPGTPRGAAVGFVIGNKGYIGTGIGGGSVFDDFWEYDPTMDSWLARTSYPGGQCYRATGFSIGSKGYVGLGNLSLTGPYTDQFWEYDPATDSWLQVSDFAAGPRDGAIGMTIGSKAYVGTGSVAPFARNDLWEYEPGTILLGQESEAHVTTSLSVWPNPNTNGELHLLLDAMPAGVIAATVDILNIEGRRISSHTVTLLHPNTPSSINLNRGMVAGIYTLCVSLGEHRFTRRIVVE